MSNEYRDLDKFKVFPPSEERSGVGYKCFICKVELEIYKYYLVTTPYRITVGSKYAGLAYRTLEFMCSEDCVNLYLLGAM